MNIRVENMIPSQKVNLLDGIGAKSIVIKNIHSEIEGTASYVNIENHIDTILVKFETRCNLKSEFLISSKDFNSNWKVVTEIPKLLEESTEYIAWCKRIGLKANYPKTLRMYMKYLSIFEKEFVFPTRKGAK